MVDTEPGLALAVIVIAGVLAQLVAQHLRVPSILLLLVTGVILGPVTDVVDPDALLGDLLVPAVGLGVGVLLFEGSLGLRLRNLERGRDVVIRLVTVGAVVTWLVGALAAWLFVGLPGDLAVLVGAILVVSGPTVILPLLRHARPRESVASVMRWEGIVIDPIGATLAIVVLDAVLEDTGTVDAAQRIGTTLGAGLLAGIVGAAVLVEALRRHWVPDRLHNGVTLSVVFSSYAAANLLRPEAGLLATTVLGLVLANQRWVAVGHIREFEENLGELILAGTFIVIGARLDLDQMYDVALESTTLAVALLVVARPLAVWVSTIGSGLSRDERTFLAVIAPRGIVAAAVASVFVIEFGERGRDAEVLVDVVTVVIVVTVAAAAVLARPVARRLRVAQAEPRGIALIGGQRWIVDLAGLLADEEVPVIVVTPDRWEAERATSQNLPVYDGRLDSEDLLVALDAVGVRQVLAASRAAELNSFGITRVAEAVGRANVFHLPPSAHDHRVETGSVAVIGRRAFAPDATQETLEAARMGGARFRVVDADDLWDGARVLVVISEGVPAISLRDKPPPAGSRVVVLASAPPED